jgi:hypothetical protein
MKNRSLLWVVLIIAGFCFSGCSSGPKLKNIPYTFGGNTSGTAEILFIDDVNGRIQFVDFEEEQLPAAETGTRWSPLQFPAGRELNLKVSFGMSRGIEYVTYRVIFKCPALEAGKKYKLWYEASEKRLILTYDKVKKLKYFLDIPSAPLYTQIHVQQIPARDIPYAFGENENVNGTAEIIFMNSISFVDFEGEQLPPLPATEEATRLYPLRFPAEKELNVRVYVFYAGDSPGYRRRGIFKCPPLEADRSYKLWYEADSKNYTGAGRLILTYGDVKSLEYSFGRPKYNQIYVQQIPPLSDVTVPDTAE